MNPLVPLPDPLPQPAPLLLTAALLQLTFFLHVLAMNVVLGGSLLGLHWRLSRRAADAGPRRRLVALLDKGLPIALAATVTLGVAPLLFVQVLYGRLFFTSSILMGWLWLGLVPLLILAYAAAYVLAWGSPMQMPAAAQGAPPAGRSRSVAARTGLATGIAVLLSAVAFLQVTNASRSLRPETFSAVYGADARGLTANLGDPSFWPRIFHVLLGAVAVAALAVALVGVMRRHADPQLGSWAVRRGLTTFVVATAANVFVGLLFLVALPKTLLVRLVGGDALSLALLAGGILLAVALAGAGLLALGARDLFTAARVVAGLLVPTLVVMLLLREDLRRLTWQRAGLDAPGPVVTQWGPLAAFFVCLIAATAAIVWMVRALSRGPAAAE